MKVIVSFLLGIVLGIAGAWVLMKPRTVTTTDSTLITPATRERLEDSIERGADAVRDTAREAGRVIADSTADARITAAIKAKLLTETSLSAFKIDVDTSGGLVTLSGSVSSADEIERAMAVARSTDGVQKVVSTLQVR